MLQLDAAKVFPGRIVTEVTPLKGFYRAEDYHQDFPIKSPHNNYIQICDIPKIAALKEQFPTCSRNTKANNKSACTLEEFLASQFISSISVS